MVKGIVSDEANKYFSTIERDVIEHSLIQVPQIINGSGKRGKLSAKYAATSEVSPIEQNGRNGLGYSNRRNEQLKAWVFFYDYGFEVLIYDSLKSPSLVLMDRIVCDWKKRKEIS